MKKNLDNKTKLGTGIFSQKKTGHKVSLSLHIMPHGQESSDVRVFSWLIGGLLIMASLIIFLMIYV